MNKKKKSAFAGINPLMSPLYEVSKIMPTIVNGKEMQSVSFRRRKIDDLFEEKKKEPKSNVLICDRLNFNTNNGDTTYGKIKTNFKPDMDEYRLLTALLERKNERLSYDEINKILGNDESSKKSGREISFIIRDIRKKIGIGKNNGGNRNIFIAGNGYRIKCK